jgi:integrase
MVPDRWRAFFAAAVFTGMRKGELCGLRKADVDLVERTITVRRSYERETTKGGHADVIPIAPALLPYVAAAVEASPSDLVFPAADGSMRSEDANTERVLRSSLARAGIVTAYEHTCRRCKAKGARHVERHQDANVRACPRCHMKLWPRPVKSKMRFHDLRHTAATLMLRAGVDPHRVQRVLRHASVTTPTGTYAHLAIEDLRDAVNKIAPQPANASRLRTDCGRRPETAPQRARTRPQKCLNSPLRWRAWRESNPRPAASKLEIGGFPRSPTGPVPSCFAGLRRRAFPRTSRRTRPITKILLH